jgi:dTDP-4-amino-4,6-dideoxygalactose transaminase
MTKLPDGPWYYEQIELGYNYRMTDIQAALGLSQMKRLNEFVEARHKIADHYNQELKEDWMITPWQHPDTYSALHLYVIRIKEGNDKVGHLQMFEKLRSAGILVNLHYIPIYRQPYYQELGFDPGDFPNSESYYKEAISIPMYSSLTIEQQNFCIERINKPTGYQNLF